jgi:hypothetical protein
MLIVEFRPGYARLGHIMSGYFRLGKNWTFLDMLGQDRTGYFML